MGHKPDYEIGSDNVFADLGLPAAPELLAKARLVFQISQIMEKKQLTQLQTAKILGIDQPKVSALVRGHLEKFSLERLCEFLTALGCDVTIQVREKRGTRVGKLLVKAA
jgi:predicted XRE-type DNA-binding protein